MKIQLYLEDEEVELQQDVSLPLTRTYESLLNPTLIIIEHSKSINIPMTKKNNRILGNAYRLDRGTIIGDGTNIGVNLDTTKKIPMRLMYNHQLIMDGYAKLESITNDAKNKFYTINLFGKLGEIFQKLLDVVVKEDTLKDGLDKSYILNDNLSGRILDRNYVYDSWNNENNKLGENATDVDIVGFAPAYRGAYQEFDSDSIEFGVKENGQTVSKIDTVSNYVTALWQDKYYSYYRGQGESDERAREHAKTTVEGLKPGELLGKEPKDYQMRDYRSYELKPYVYFNQLMRMYQQKCKELTGYDLVLDVNWFNSNNPYWTDMCYMMDFLESSGQQVENKVVLNNGYSGHNFGVDDTRVYKTISSPNVSKVSGVVNVSPHTVNVKFEFNTDEFNIDGELKLLDDTMFLFDIFVSTQQHVYFWYRPSGPAGGWEGNYDETNFIIPKITYYSSGNKMLMNAEFVIPEFNLSFPSSGSTVKTYLTIYNSRGYAFDYIYSEMVGYIEQRRVVHLDFRKYVKNYYLNWNKMYADTGWRSLIQVKMSNLYYKDEPLFNAILNYTKMFNLYWDVDYVQRKVYIKTRKNLFKNSTLVNWSKKLNREKEFKVTPMIFPEKYIKFNYEDVDGYKYTGYNDKYGCNIGEKIMIAANDFNNDTKDLFENIHPSSASSRTYLPFIDVLNYHPKDNLTKKTDDKVLIDADDEKEEAPITLYNWYLRGKNQKLDYYLFISDDTHLMKTQNKHCFLEPSYAATNDFAIPTQSFPSFNVAEKDKNGVVLGCIFNQPNEDYTISKLPTAATGNYIYDLFWKDYLNERYNVQNKKVAAYFNLNPQDFLTLKFNQFVILNNQVFVINKIFDYNLNSNESTKVELVQVTNRYMYGFSQIEFPILKANPVNITALPGSYPDDAGTVAVPVYGLPSVTDAKLYPSKTYNGTVDIQQIVPTEYGADVIIGFSQLGHNKEFYSGSLSLSNAEAKIEVRIDLNFLNWQTDERYKITAEPASVTLIPEYVDDICSADVKFTSQIPPNEFVTTPTTTIQDSPRSIISPGSPVLDEFGNYTTNVKIQIYNKKGNSVRFEGEITGSNGHEQITVPYVADYSVPTPKLRAFSTNDRIYGGIVSNRDVIKGQVYESLVTAASGEEPGLKYTITEVTVADSKGNLIESTFAPDRDYPYRGTITVDNPQTNLYITIKSTAPNVPINNLKMNVNAEPQTWNNPASATWDPVNAGGTVTFSSLLDFSKLNSKEGDVIEVTGWCSTPEDPDIHEGDPIHCRVYSVRSERSGKLYNTTAKFTVENFEFKRGIFDINFVAIKGLTTIRHTATVNYSSSYLADLINITSPRENEPNGGYSPCRKIEPNADCLLTYVINDTKYQSVDVVVNKLSTGEIVPSTDYGNYIELTTPDTDISLTVTSK